MSDDDSQPPRPPRQLVPPLMTEVIILLKYLSNFWRSLNLPWINCEVELDLLGTKYCVLSEDVSSLSNAAFQINSSKLYFPVCHFFHER